MKVISRLKDFHKVAQENKESEFVLAGGRTSVLFHCCISPTGPILVLYHFKQLPLVCVLYPHIFQLQVPHDREQFGLAHTDFSKKGLQFFSKKV